MTRERTFSWEEPIPFRHRLEGKSGLELLQRAVAGEFPPPPIAMMMDIRLTEVERGRAVFTGMPQEFHYNPLGTVHGGYGATLLDSAMGCAVHSTLDAGDIYTTLELKINYIRSMTHDTGVVRGIAKVISETRTTAICGGTNRGCGRKAVRVCDDDLRNKKGRTRVSESGPDGLLARRH